MMENGKHRARGQLTPEEKWEIFLEVTSKEISQVEAARKHGVDVSVIVGPAGTRSAGGAPTIRGPRQSPRELDRAS